MVDQVNNDSNFFQNYMEKKKLEANNDPAIGMSSLGPIRLAIDDALKFKYPPEIAGKNLSDRLDHYLTTGLDEFKANAIIDFKAFVINPTAAVRNESDLNITAPSFASAAQTPDGESQLDKIKSLPGKVAAGASGAVGAAGLGFAAATNSVVDAVKAPFVGLKNIAVAAATGVASGAHAITMPKKREEAAQKRATTEAKKFDDVTIATGLDEPVRNAKNVDELRELGEAVKKATAGPERDAANFDFLKKAEEIMTTKGSEAAADARNSIDPNFKGKIKPGEDEISKHSVKLKDDVSKVLEDVANSPELAGDPNAERIRKTSEMLKAILESIKNMVASIFKSSSSGPDNKASAGPRPG